jgi:hypothetical protein
MGKTAKKRVKRKSSPMRLLYNIHPANLGLVFAEPERAHFISRIHRAICDSATWREFRLRMPRDEYSRVMREWFDEQGEPRPRGADEFELEMVPGYCDGDYPDWLQAEMHKILPVEILEEFAIRENSMLNGPYIHINAEHLSAITSRLENLGYVVEDGTHLSFG